MWETQTRTDLFVGPTGVASADCDGQTSLSGKGAGRGERVENGLDDSGGCVTAWARTSSAAAVSHPF
jgi:hypothetical protein